MYYYSGPEGYFVVKSIEDGERIIQLMDVDSDEWTATEIDHDMLKSLWNK